jgi:hypothetical protein
MKYKVYYFWNDHQKQLLGDYFLPSFLNYNDGDFELNGIKFDEDFGNTAYGTSGYKRLIIDRVKKLISILKKNNEGEFFIMTDIDVQFFGSIKDIINDKVDCDFDMVFQSESPFDKIVNCGFMLIKTTQSTIKFWENILNTILSFHDGHFIHDQHVANDMLKETPNCIKWDRFDSRIWAWSYGGLNKDILLHHANCCSSIIDKNDQLSYVKSYIYK